MNILPTWPKPKGIACKAFLDQLLAHLKRDKKGKDLTMYFYAVTKTGWDCVWPSVRSWKEKRTNREVSVFCGLANWVTDPKALAVIMQQLPGKTFILPKKQGIFHPKAFIFHEANNLTCFIGSNNLSGPGLNSNYELGVVIRQTSEDAAAPKGLHKWEQAIKSAAVPLTDTLLQMYREEYDKMSRLPRNPGVVGKKRARNGPTALAAGLPLPGTAILEVMPRETGTGGSQLQIPWEVARAFFTLPSGGQKSIHLRDNSNGSSLTLTFTDYGNSTRRLYIRRLAVEPRPCVIWFKRENGAYVFDIVSQESNPREYDRLFLLCPFQTAYSSKHWGMYEDDPEFSLI